MDLSDTTDGGLHLVLGVEGAQVKVNEGPVGEGQSADPCHVRGYVQDVHYSLDEVQLARKVRSRDGAAGVQDEEDIGWFALADCKENKCHISSDRAFLLWEGGIVETSHGDL